MLTTNDIPLGEDDGEKGVALLELAISLPVLVILFLGLVDVSNMLINYMSLSQIADEAVRTLSSVPQLKENTGSSEFSYETLKAEPNLETNCRNNSASDQRCGHLLAQTRVQYLSQLLQFQDLVPSNGANVEVWTAYRKSGAGTEDDTVRVRISARFNGLFFFTNSFPVSVSAQGPYLY